MFTSPDHERTSQDNTDSSFVGAAPAVDDRRASDRICEHLPIELSAMGGPDAQPCTASDISEDGLFLSVPADCGLTVGQRCEVTFGGQSPPALSSLDGETHFATVVRTAVLADGSESRVGAGLRFDQRLYL